jgi:hypothetical protein
MVTGSPTDSRADGDVDSHDHPVDGLQRRHVAASSPIDRGLGRHLGSLVTAICDAGILVSYPCRRRRLRLLNLIDSTVGRLLPPADLSVRRRWRSSAGPGSA